MKTTHNKPHKSRVSARSSAKHNAGRLGTRNRSPWFKHDFKKATPSQHIEGESVIDEEKLRDDGYLPPVAEVTRPGKRNRSEATEGDEEESYFL